MAQGTNTYDRYDITGSREDLSKMIYMISPTEVPVQSNIGMSSSDAIFKEWQTDSLPAATDIMKIDGDQFSADAIAATTRLGNYHQIAWYGLLVSRRADIVNKAGRRSETGYQIARHGKALRRSSEVTITTRKRSVVGTSSTAGQLAGIPAWIATNDQLGASGSSPTLSGGTPNSAGTVGTARAFTEQYLDTAVLNCYDDGGNPDALYPSTRLKAALSKYLFSSSSRVATQYQDQGRKPMKGTTVVGAVDVFVSDFFVLDIVPDRFTPSGASATEVMLLDSEYWEMSFLSPYHIKDIADDGDATRRMLIVDYTVCAKHEGASAVVAAINDTEAVTATP